MSLEFAATVRQGAFTLAAELVAEPGEVVALLGPNGAGKSTLLRAIAGLRPVSLGSVTLDQELLDDRSLGVFVAPQQRRIGMVFQNHRLFPHLTALQNVAFGLRSQGISRTQAHAEASRWLAALGLSQLAGGKPRQLSGGQAQRVALARAIASRPRALLLDEPLAALDVQTRSAVQGELRQHLHDFAGPTLLVTHDPIEALLLASRIVVLQAGTIVQQGTPTQITSRPLTEYVAQLVGMNLYQGVADGNSVVTLEDGGTIVVPDVSPGRVLVAVRPSAFTVHTSTPSLSSARNIWSGTIAGLAPLGDRIRLTVTGAHAVLVDVTAAAVAELDLLPGTPVWLTAKATDIAAYRPDAAG